METSMLFPRFSSFLEPYFFVKFIKLDFALKGNCWCFSNASEKGNPRINTRCKTTYDRENGEKHKCEAIFILLFDNLAKKCVNLKMKFFPSPFELHSPLHRERTVVRTKEAFEEEWRTASISQRLHILASCLRFKNYCKAFFSEEGDFKSSLNSTWRFNASQNEMQI